MTWALTNSPASGVYHPHGDFVGLDEQRRAYFESLPQEAKAVFGGFAGYALFATKKFLEEIGTISGGPPPLTPIEPHEIPHTFRTKSSYSNLASLIMLPNRLLAVDQQLKEIIERLEPGVHQFFPIQITMPRERAYPKPYFLLVIGQFLEGFRPEQSPPEVLDKNYRLTCWRRTDWSDKLVFVLEIDSFCCPHLAFSRSAIGGAHLWRERRALMNNILISDALQAEIAAAKLRIWKHWRVKEVLP